MGAVNQKQLWFLTNIRPILQTHAFHDIRFRFKQCKLNALL